MPKKDRKASRTTPGFTGPFKGAPQQGTLFDKRTVDQAPANQALTADRVGPRGYSLNRSRQFQDVIGRGQGRTDVTTKYRSAEPGEESRADYSPVSKSVREVNPGEHPYGPTEHTMSVKSVAGAKGMQRGRSKIIDTLARSTVSPEHLAGLGGISVHGKDPKYAGSYHGGGHWPHIRLNVTGTSPESEYGPPSEVKQPKQFSSSHPDPEITLIHEIGHHVSKMQKTEHSAYDTHPRKAAEEGFADNFAMTHWRRDPRRQAWHGNVDPREHTYQARGDIPGGHTAEYHKTMEPKNRPPEKRTVISSMAERQDRPMLGTDVHHNASGVLTVHHGGMWDKTVKPDTVRGWNNDPEQAVYGRGMQKSNRAQSGYLNKKLTPERWQTRRGSMGRQF